MNLKPLKKRVFIALVAALAISASAAAADVKAAPLVCKTASEIAKLTLPLRSEAKTQARMSAKARPTNISELQGQYNAKYSLPFVGFDDPIESTMVFLPGETDNTAYLAGLVEDEYLLCDVDYASGRIVLPGSVDLGTYNFIDGPHNVTLKHYRINDKGDGLYSCENDPVYWVMNDDGSIVADDPLDFLLASLDDRDGSYMLAAGGHEFELTPVVDSDDEWVSLGECSFNDDGYVLPFLGLSSEIELTCDFQQNIVNHNLYRLHNPYGQLNKVLAENGLSTDDAKDKVSVLPGAIILDVTYPGCVQVVPNFSGVTYKRVFDTSNEEYEYISTGTIPSQLKTVVDNLSYINNHIAIIYNCRIWPWGDRAVNISETFTIKLPKGFILNEDDPATKVHCDYDFDTSPSFFPLLQARIEDGGLGHTADLDFIDRYGYAVSISNYVGPLMEQDENGQWHAKEDKVRISLGDGEVYSKDADGKWRCNGLEMDYSEPFISYGNNGPSCVTWLNDYGTKNVDVTRENWSSTMSSTSAIAFMSNATSACTEDTYIQFPEIDGGANITVWAGHNGGSFTKELRVKIVPIVDGIEMPAFSYYLPLQQTSAKQIYKLTLQNLDKSTTESGIRIWGNPYNGPGKVAYRIGCDQSEVMLCCVRFEERTGGNSDEDEDTPEFNDYAGITETIYMSLKESANLGMYLNHEASDYSIKNSNPAVVSVTSDNVVTANSYGSTTLTYSLSGKPAAIFNINVCPIVTLEHGDGVVYEHHVLYNSRPTLHIAPAKDCEIGGVMHDGADVSDKVIENGGYYIPDEPITANSVINVSMRCADSSTDLDTPADDVAAAIKVLVNGHNIQVTGADDDDYVVITNLSGITIYNSLRKSTDISECGLYLVSVHGQTFKIIIR